MALRSALALHMLTVICRKGVREEIGDLIQELPSRLHLSKRAKCQATGLPFPPNRERGVSRGVRH